MGAWRFGARAHDGRVNSPQCTPPSLTSDEHLVKEVRQSAKHEVVQQPTPLFIYLFSVVFLIVVLVSYSQGSSELFITYFIPRGSLGLACSPQHACLVVCMTYDILGAIVHILPLLIAPPNQVVQLFLADIKVQYPHIFTSHPFSRTFSSPPAIIIEPAVCESPQPFATSPPISIAPTMSNSLVEETKRIVAQFDYTDDDLNKGVQEFLRQMSTTNETPSYI